MSYNSISFALKPEDVVGFTEPQRNSIELQASLSIVVEPAVIYKNFKYPRYETFYGYCQIMSGAFVAQSIQLNYLNQELLHWQHSSTDLNQSIGCGVKKILLALTPPVESVVTVALLRQRYTSIRFRFVPGVLANFNLTWHFPEQLCDELLVYPPEAQGNPPDPNNSSGNPGNRPPDQGGDPRDRSPNDGQDPEGDEDAPPAPLPGTYAGSWKVSISGVDVDGNGFSFTYDTDVRDPQVRVTAYTENVPENNEIGGQPNKYLWVVAGGNARNTGASGGGLTVNSVSFY